MFEEFPSSNLWKKKKESENNSTEKITIHLQQEKHITKF